MTGLRAIVPATAPHPTIAGVDTLRLVPGTDVPTLSSLVTGVKWNARATMVITGQILWRLGNGGLTARFTPLVGIDYLF